MNKLIATTALAIILGGPVFAQETQESENVLPQAGQGEEAEQIEIEAEEIEIQVEDDDAASQPEAAQGGQPSTQPEADTAGTEQPMPEEAGETDAAGTDDQNTDGMAETDQSQSGMTETEAAEGDQPMTDGAPETEAAEGDAPAMGEQTDADMVGTEPEGETETMQSEQMMTDETETATAGGEEWRAEREVLIAPALELDGFTQAPADEISVENLVGTEVYDTSDEGIGSVSDVIMNDSGVAEYAVVEVGGFLGLGARSVALGFDEMQIMRGEGDELRAYVDVSEEQLEALPEYEAAEN